jgi:lipopolysaccharide transport system ATP-binding protein
VTSAITVRQLSKRYRIGAVRERYPTMRDAVAAAASAPWRAARRAWRGARRPSARTPTFWALKNVTFDVAPGEVVGVVGRNGAGKSTLLKVLSRITEPTEGWADIRGRVGSLLEVGTGFHHELTGRENIYLNGAILGMKRAETDRKFDEIVDFAEVGAFIDTPVKHYSSGMHLRLAFAVAAHLEPEILLVDEVLAVGDLAFQRKCLGKMETVAANGRTVLFVSHNLAAVKELCHSAIVLSQGELVFRGPVVAGLAQYSQRLLQQTDGVADGGTRWWAVGIDGQRSGIAVSVRSDRGFTAEAQLDVREELSGAVFFFMMHDASGNVVVHRRVAARDIPVRLSAGRHQVRVHVPPLWLAPGVYSVMFKLLGTSADAAEGRFLSERALVDVCGESDGLSGAVLAPAVHWSLTADVSTAAPCDLPESVTLDGAQAR